MLCLMNLCFLFPTFHPLGHPLFSFASPVPLDQFEDYAHASSLLPNHGASTGRGAWLELLDDHVPATPSSPVRHDDDM
jgi:hypothetical protein